MTSPTGTNPTGTGSTGAAGHGSTGATRVLIVDDDVRVARNHRELVESMPGFTVVASAHTAAEALEAVRRHRPGLVLLDLFLPDRTGLAVLEELRSAAWLREVGVVDVVLITALRDVEHVRTAMAMGRLMRTRTSAPPRRTRAAFFCTSVRA